MPETIKHEITLDIQKNRLYLKLVGFTSSKSIVKTAALEAIAAVTRLQPGFDVVNDISEYKPATPENAREILALLVSLRQSGMRRVVRVIGRNILTDAQFTSLSKTAGYAVHKVGTLAEAEAYLDGLLLQELKGVSGPTAHSLEQETINIRE